MKKRKTDLIFNTLKKRAKRGEIEMYSLAKLKDKMAIEYAIQNKGGIPSGRKSLIYKEGFDAAVNLLVPEAQALADAVKKRRDCGCVECFSREFKALTRWR